MKYKVLCYLVFYSCPKKVNNNNNHTIENKYTQASHFNYLNRSLQHMKSPAFIVYH